MNRREHLTWRPGKAKSRDKRRKAKKKRGYRDRRNRRDGRPRGRRS